MIFELERMFRVQPSEKVFRVQPSGCALVKGRIEIGTRLPRRTAHLWFLGPLQRKLKLVL